MNDLRVQKLEDHLKHEHKQSPLADYFKEVIYGGVDGIVTTFAVVAGFSGAALSNETTTQLTFVTVLLFGLANLFADAASMGLGNFLSVRSDQDLYKAAREKEKEEVRTNTAMEIEESVTILMQKGFSEADAKQLVSIYQHNEEYWVDFMMNHELEMPDPRGDNPMITGFMTFISFIIFGSIPLLPFIIAPDDSTAEVFRYSVIGTFGALVTLGLMKWRVIGTGLGKSLFEVVAVGGVAAFIAFFVGTLFKV